MMEPLFDRHEEGRWPYASPYTVYHEKLAAQYYPLLELDSSNGLSTELRDTLTTSGSGSITNNDAEHVLSTGTTAGSTATLRTKERGRYQPGLMARAGMCIRRPVAPTGDQEIWWEYGDGTDSARIGEDATGLYIKHIRDGSDQGKVWQTDWNNDTVDGSGDSGNPSLAQLDMTKHNIWRVDFAHYGNGPIQFHVAFADQDGTQKYIKVHEITASSGTIIFGNPKLPLRQNVDNGITTSDLQVFVGGREYAILGRYEPNRRQTSAFASNGAVGTTLIPLVTFRKKSARVSTSKSVKVSGLGVMSDADAAIEIIINGTLTGASYGSIDNIPDAETAMEVDTSATAITSGIRLDGALVSGGSGNRRNAAGIRALGLDIPDNTNITLAVRSLSGTAAIDGVFTVEEEW